jgi:hypothetical protein
MTMVDARTSWNVKDDEVVKELLGFMNLSDAEAQLLHDLSDQARAIVPSLTETFYERLFKHAHTAEFLEGRSMERLHSMVGDWFIEMFTGPYDSDYAHKRINIGKIHVKIGLPVRYPLAMLDVIMDFGEQVTRQSSQPEAALVAFRKVFALDVAVFNQAYESSQLAHLSDLVGGERLARLLLTGVDD